MAILVFSGHRIDGPARLARFPPARVGLARAQLQGALVGLGKLAAPRAAVCSLAAGGDLLFALACLRQRLPLHVVLPFRQRDFVGQSVSYAKAAGGSPPVNWLALYQLVLRRATTVRFSSQAPYRPGAHQFRRCNERLLQLAGQQAAQAHTTVRGVLLLQTAPAALPGGSQEFSHLLRRKHIFVHQRFPGALVPL